MTTVKTAMTHDPQMLHQVCSIISGVVYNHERIEPAGRKILEVCHHAELVALLTKAAPFVGWASKYERKLAGEVADTLCDQIDALLANLKQDIESEDISKVDALLFDSDQFAAIRDAYDNADPSLINRILDEVQQARLPEREIIERMTRNGGGQ